MITNRASETSVRDNEGFARDLEKSFGLDHATSQALYEEVMLLGKKDAKALKKDSQKCSDAVSGDKLSISSIDELMKRPWDQTLQDTVRKGTQEDMNGDRQALADDQTNMHRATRIAALDQALIDRGELLGKPLTAEQQAALANDRNNKIQDALNCLQDFGHEDTYIAHDQALVSSLGSVVRLEELKAAAGKVTADRNMDISMEGGPAVAARGARAAQAGAGFIGQDERSIESDVQMTKAFRP